VAQPCEDFPAWAGRDLTARDPTARLVLLASDGATSSMAAGEQLRWLGRLGSVPTLATVTMGGNDLLAAYGDARAARRAIATVVDNGRLVLAGLRELMGPEAPILVATVYDPSDGSGDAGRLGLPPWPEGLEVLAELNRVLWVLAEEYQALVADVHARFLDHGLAAGDPTQPAARPHDRGLWYCGLIEPNAWGPARSGPASGTRLPRRVPSGHDGLGQREHALTGATIGRRTVVPTVHAQAVEVTPRRLARVAQDRQLAASPVRVPRNCT
jgi:GDSL-like Lipase/Acylhydrolase family